MQTAKLAALVGRIARASRSRTGLPTQGRLGVDEACSSLECGSPAPLAGGNILRKQRASGNAKERVSAGRHEGNCDSQRFGAQRFIGSSAAAYMSKEGDSSENKGLRQEWGSWISNRFLGAEKSKPLEAGNDEPTDEEINAEVQRSISDSAVQQVSDDGDEEDAQMARTLWNARDKGQDTELFEDSFAIEDVEERDELVELLEKAEGDPDDWKAVKPRPIRGKDFSMWEEGERGSPANQSELDGLKEEGVLSDAALAAIEEYDLEDLERPYRFRNDRLYYPGQTYEMDELDLSSTPPPMEYDAVPPRSRLTFTTKDALDKADFRNPRFLLQFTTETSKIMSRTKTKLSAKAQRKVSRKIRTARIMGLVPFTTIGQPPFRFGKLEDSRGS